MASPASPPRANRRGLWLALAVTAASVVLLLVLVDARAVAEQLRRSDWRYLAAASAALLAGMAAYTLRWWLLLGGHAGWRSVFEAACAGHAVNLLVPMRVGEAVRLLVLARRAVLPLGQVTSSVVVERLWEQMMRLTALVGAIALGAGLRPSPVTLTAGAALVAGAALAVAVLRRRQDWVLATVPRWLARLPRLEEAPTRHALLRLLAGLALATRPRQLVQGALCSLGVWACFWAFHGLALLALAPGLAPQPVAALALGALALAPPSAPTAPGVYHASIVVPLALVGYPETALTAFAVVAHALMLAWLLPLGLAAALRSGVAPREVLPAA